MPFTCSQCEQCFPHAQLQSDSYIVKRATPTSSQSVTHAQTGHIYTLTGPKSEGVVYDISSSASLWCGSVVALLKFQGRKWVPYMWMTSKWPKLKPCKEVQHREGSSWSARNRAEKNGTLRPHNQLKGWYPLTIWLQLWQQKRHLYQPILNCGKYLNLNQMTNKIKHIHKITFFSWYRQTLYQTFNFHIQQLLSKITIHMELCVCPPDEW